MKQYGAIRFFDDINKQREFIYSKDNSIATYFRSGEIPAFQFFLETSETSGTAKLINSQTGSEIVFSIILEDSGAVDWKRIRHNIEANASVTDGIYYFELVIDGTTYYSDRFVTCTTFSNRFIKVVYSGLGKVGISSLQMEYSFSSSYQDVFFLIGGENVTSEMAATEEGTEKIGLILQQNFETNPILSVDLLATDKCFQFLAMSRVFTVSNSVKFEINGELYDVSYIDSVDSTPFDGTDSHEVTINFRLDDGIYTLTD